MTKNIYKAIADFQQEVPCIHKGTEGYGYSYTDLPAIFEVINPLMKKHGMGFYQAVNGTQLKTVIFHVESGEAIESNTDIPQGVSLSKMNDFQVLGSGITYLRRYAISALLGLVTDKDTDAGGEQVRKAPVATVDPLVAFQKATEALENAQTLAKIDEVMENVKKSKNLTKEQKAELTQLSISKSNEMMKLEQPFP